MKRTAILVAAFGLSACAVVGQSSQTQPCVLEQPSLKTTGTNIFSDQQEQDLGDALAEELEQEMHIAPPGADDQLTKIGEKLLATLPPTGIHFRFRVYDSGEINGFSLVGGHVYISRKLIAATKTEDELAGVVAHEIGHIITHQEAIEFSQVFRIRLGITHFGDRADVFARVHQLFETPAKSNEPEDNEEKDQLVADQVAMYPLVRAGYSAESFASFFNQVTLNKGKTGNWFTDRFGLTHEETKRYRTALKLVVALPAGCQGRPQGSSEAFQAWVHSVVDERIKTVAEGTSGDQPLKLESPLRPSLWRIRFSPDGKYVLAQDESGISILDKDQAKVLFRIDAPDVEAAQFTPDSREIVFHDSKLRIERWDAATGKRISVKELIVFDGCNHTLLSKDGKTLLCTSTSIDSTVLRVRLRLIDVESGNAIYDKPKFHEVNALFSPSSMEIVTNAIRGEDLVTSVMSPDGKYLIVAIESTILAYDLEQRHPIALGGKLKGLNQTRMSFYGPDQLFVVGSQKSNGLYETRTLSFPDGALITEGEIGDQTIRAVSKGHLIAAGPLKNYEVGVFDAMQNKFVDTWKLPTIDVWNPDVAAENASGRVSLGKIGDQSMQHVDLPLGALPPLRAAAFSPDGKYLVISVKGRSELWELQSGKSLHLMRPFNQIWIDREDHLFGQCPKYLNYDPQDVEVTIEPLALKNLGKFEPGDWLYGDMRYRLRSMGKGKSISSHAHLEVRRMGAETLLWSRDYPQGTPAFWAADNGRITLAWDLSNDAAKAEIKNNPRLQKEADAFKNHKKGILIEAIAARTGELQRAVVIPEVDLTQGWNDQRRAFLSGDVVLAQGEHGNTVIYSLENGTKIGDFFGYAITADAELGIVVSVNRESEILIVDEHTGAQLQRFSLGAPVRAAQVMGTTEKRLMVLTADQVVHRLPLPKRAGITPAPLQSSSHPDPVPQS